LKRQLAEEQGRPTGHTISNCHIDMSAPDPTKVAIAEAVREGMKALQGLGGDSYGIYLPSKD
jgi:hypothetical protein